MMEQQTVTKKSMKPNSKEALLELEHQAQNLVSSLGYEIVALEMNSAPKSAGKTLTLYIDFLDQPTATTQTQKRISLDDCVAVNTAVDTLFEQTSLLDGAYTLEVSSPGVERPLRKQADFVKFKNNKVRINTQRPLSAEELQNADYAKKNAKQKNFVGILVGLNTSEESVVMHFDGVTVHIPLNLITKAHLEYMPPENLSK